MIPIKSNMKGLSLIELLIAITLGMIILSAVFEIFISTKQTFTATDILSRSQENGRFALEFMEKDIRMAGYKGGNAGTVPLPIYDCTNNTQPNDAAVCATDGGGNASDRIAVQYDPQDSGATDCLGNTVATNSNIVNAYYIANDVNGEGALFCRSYNPATAGWVAAGQTLINGVENMQILYSETNGANRSYVSADRVTDWSNVDAARISLLVSSGGNGYLEDRTRAFILLDAPTLTFTDKRSRYLYTTTTSFKNANEI